MGLSERLDEFLRRFYYNELQRASAHGMGAIIIDFALLDRFDPLTADELLEMPETVLSAFQDALKHNLPDVKLTARIRNIPESRQIRIKDLRAEHLNRLICIDAVIKSASEVKPQIYEAIFECPECGAHISIPQPGNLIQKASVCECGRRGDFKLVDKKMFDMRWLTGVEPFEVTTGEQPGEIAIFLKEDLTVPKLQKKTDPGSRLKIVGFMKEMPKWIKGKLSTKLDTYIEANYFESSEMEYDDLEVKPEDEELIKSLSKDPKIFEKLVASIAPGIYGYEEIKESVVLQLFGGIPRRLPDGTRIRDNIHILLTGDPGIGKSQILKLISTIVPRGKYVSGKGVTGSGLTATVVKNEIIGGWVLEAGAMVLTNKSVIGIDEFDKMHRDDQIAMHEAMSVGTVSIAKASIVATLPAQTSVLAAANPKLGRFDPFVPITEQIEIPETLLSRFDLKFALRDRPDKFMDERLADHIITARVSPKLVEPVIHPLILRKYIAYARKIASLELPPESSEKLKAFYIDMRTRHANEETTTVSITLRQYEALIRLAEASAKVRLDSKITIHDAERAIKLMKYSLTQLGYDYESGRIDIDRIESGISSSRRSKLRQIMEIVETLQKESGKDVAIEDIRAEAESRGIEGIDEVIEKLKNEGMVFQPRSGFLRKV